MPQGLSRHRHCAVCCSAGVLFTAAIASSSSQEHEAAKESFHPLQRQQSHPRVEPSAQSEHASAAIGMHPQSLRAQSLMLASLRLLDSILLSDFHFLFS